MAKIMPTRIEAEILCNQAIILTSLSAILHAMAMDNASEIGMNLARLSGVSMATAERAKSVAETHVES